jgi:hypothetical protein
MPTTLGKSFSVGWRGHPPHMLFPDVPVWYSWLEKYGQFINRLYYDCLLGGPWMSPAQLADPLSYLWAHNTSKRADAIAELKDEVWIIEVSTSPGLRAIGQLLSYQSLWIEDPKINKPEKLVLVCANLDTDLIACAARYGIVTYVTPITYKKT